MIRSFMKRMAGKRQRGGIAILTALGFLLFSVPVISGSLGLASSINVDSQVKTGILNRDYCGLAVEQYINYLVQDATRWGTWLAANEDLGNPGTFIGTEDVCGQNITLTVVQGAPIEGLDGFLGTAVGESPFANRDFQSTKTVSDANPIGGSSVTYTITVLNHGATPVGLNIIRDTLPPGFSYYCNPPQPDQLTLPGLPPQNIVPDVPCPSGGDVAWTMPGSTSIESAAEVTLTFTAITSLDTGAYCNEVQVVPGGNKTTSGMTAIVEIGTPAAQPLCTGKAVLGTQSVDSVTLVSTDTSTVPFTYTFDVDYTITMTNIGTEDLEIQKFEDLLPGGFTYFAMIPSGDITDPPSQLFYNNQLDRQEVTWNMSPNFPLPSGTAVTLKFSTVAVTGSGLSYVDLLVTFAGGAFPQKLYYSWPTGVVSLIDVYSVTATLADGSTIVVDLEVWFQGDSGDIATWDLG